MKKYSYEEFKTEMLLANTSGIEREGVIVFREDNWPGQHSLESRSFKVSSSAQAFNPAMVGYSLFGEALDQSETIRLDAYMADESGGKDGWQIEYCYFLDEE